MESIINELYYGNICPVEQMGRSVKRGEAGITILAPSSYRRLEDVEEEGPDGRTVTTRKLVEHRPFGR